MDACAELESILKNDLKSYIANNSNNINTDAVLNPVVTQYVDAEVRSAKGRADAVVNTKDRIYVFEFKLEGTEDEALKQIDEKGYLLPYRTDGRELVKVGVSFNAEERNIGEYKVI